MRSQPARSSTLALNRHLRQKATKTIGRSFATIAAQVRIHPYLETAPVVIAVCGLPKASPTWIMDVSAATENMLLAATAMGLGAAWVGAPDTVL